MHGLPQEALEESFRKSSEFGTLKLGKNATLYSQLGIQLGGTSERAAVRPHTFSFCRLTGGELCRAVSAQLLDLTIQKAYLRLKGAIRPQHHVSAFLSLHAVPSARQGPPPPLLAFLAQN